MTTATPTDRRKLGSSPLTVTQMGFGSAPLGDLFARLDEDAALGAVAAAYDAGFTLFDTSPYYGYGLAEHRVGHVLRRKPRNSYVLSTKVGRVMNRAKPESIDRGRFQGGLDFQGVFDYSYDGAMRSFEQSLMRLGVGRLDVMLIHDADVWTHKTPEAADRVFRQAMEGAYVALDELRRNGDIGAIGCGLNEADTCARFARAGDFDCMLLAGRYSLLEQGALDDLLPLCVEKDIGIMLGGTFNSGILATGARPGAKYNYVDAPPDVLHRVARIEKVCAAHGVPLAAAAMRFPLGHPKISSIVLGAVKAEEVRRNVETFDTAIPSGLWDDLKREGLLRQDAPVPG